MKVSVVIATHGGDSWRDLAWSRAYPSAVAAAADEILIGHDPDGSRAEVRNRLTRQAAGPYVVTLDADDELAPGYCDAIRKHAPPSLVVPRVDYVGRRQSRGPVFLQERRLHEDNWIVVGAAFPKDLFLHVGGWRILLGTGTMNEADDWDLWIRMIQAGASVVKEPDAVYRAFVDRPSVHRRAGVLQRRRWAEEIRALNWPDGVPA